MSLTVEARQAAHAGEVPVTTETHGREEIDGNFIFFSDELSC